MLQQEVKLSSGNKIQRFLLRLKSSPDTSPARSGRASSESEGFGNASHARSFIVLPCRITRKTRRSWVNLPREVTCPREPVLQDSHGGGRLARGPPGEAGPGRAPAASSLAPASPRRRFPGAPDAGRRRGGEARCSGAPRPRLRLRLRLRPRPGGGAPLPGPGREGLPPGRPAGGGPRGCGTRWERRR